MIACRSLFGHAHLKISAWFRTLEDQRLLSILHLIITWQALTTQAVWANTEVYLSSARFQGIRQSIDIHNTRSFLRCLLALVFKWREWSGRGELFNGHGIWNRQNNILIPVNQCCTIRLAFAYSGWPWSVVLWPVNTVRPKFQSWRSLRKEHSDFVKHVQGWQSTEMELCT